MKNKHISIKWKIFSLFLIFAIVLIGVLWFFQIVYLNDFYKMIKRSETEDVLDQVEAMLLTTDDCDSDINTLAASNNLAIYITDNKGNPLHNAEYIVNSQMSSLPDYMFELFYSQAKANDGEAVIEYKGSEMLDKEKYNMDMMPQTEEDPKNPANKDSGIGTAEIVIDGEEGGQSEGRLEFTIPKIEEQQEFMQNIGDDMAESVIYVRIVNIDDVEKVIMVNSVLTPVDATVSTLKRQLVVISVIMIIVAFVIAFGVSRSLSKSIIKINDGASKLAEGNFDVAFDSRDCQELSELSDTLNFTAKELSKADSLQKELIANVSHDLRTPLTMIKGYSEVMRDIPGENTPENVQAIIDETERLAGLVNDMLDISKLKAGTIQLKRQDYNITASIRHVLERYNKLREVEGYTIDFLYDAEVTVYADEQKMYQVIYNLVNNAINYTGSDKKVTVVQILTEDTLRLEVRDTGEGVSQEDIPYVWDRYYKDKKTHKRAVQGTGLGLSIVKNILELHGAKYGVSSIQGKGATFWFELPLSPDIDE